MKRELCRWFILVLPLTALSCQQSRDIINDEFPEAQTEIKRVIDEILESALDKNLDLLSSFHLYGAKYTEFKNGAPRAGARKGEQREREFFSAVTDLEIDLRDLEVNVFGDVAIATCHGSFQGKMGEAHLSSRGQNTIVFVKTANTWKIVHEHFSPLKQTE